jgi:exopolysaccharide biosynthesis polyprenyl glycosylphosphotransferase
MDSPIGLPQPQQLIPRSVSELVLDKPVGRRVSAALFRSCIVMLEVIADFGTVIAVAVLAYSIYSLMGVGKTPHFPPALVFEVSTALAGVIVLMLDRVGTYSGGTSLLRARETEQVLRVSAHVLTVAFALSVLADLPFSRWLLVITAALLPLFLFVQKQLIYMLVQVLHSRGYGVERVLIYGSGSTARRVFSVLRRSPKLGLDPVAFVDENLAKAGSTIFEMGYEPRRSAPVIRAPLTRDLVARYNADLVIVAVSSLQQPKLQETVREVLAAHTRVSFVPSDFLQPDSCVDFQDIDGVLLASGRRSPRRHAYEWAKRLSDVAGAVVLLVLGLPVFIVLAILVRLGSQGPAIFRQERVGLQGRPFCMFKFRTMYVDAAAYAYSPRVPDDPRITRVGRFLRRTSLDELPQLINVLAGKMSLVGPRPEMPFIVEQYTGLHRQRLQVKPGITGLWQLSGDRAYLIHENIEYDLYYIQHRNFFLDLAILVHTAIFAMRGI